MIWSRVEDEQEGPRNRTLRKPQLDEISYFKLCYYKLIITACFYVISLIITVILT